MYIKIKSTLALDAKTLNSLETGEVFSEIVKTLKEQEKR